MIFLTTYPITSSDTITIVVTEAIGDTLCMVPDDGQKLYDLIAAAFKQGKNVILDCQNIEETTPGFFDSAIGQLYKHFSEDQIEASLSLVDADRNVAYDIKNAVYWTKEYLKDPQRFKEAAREFLGDDDE